MTLRALSMLMLLSLCLLPARAQQGAAEQAARDAEARARAANEKQAAARDQQIAAEKAAADAKAKAEEEPEYLVGDPHVQTLPAMHYLHAAEQATFAKIMEPIEKHLTALTKASKEGKFHLSSGPVFSYTGVDFMNMDKPFNLQVGFPVEEGTKEFAPYKLRKTDPFKCLTVLYTGPITHIDKAYMRAMPAVLAGGHKMTGETREAYLYWEKPESPNNVIQLQIGIK
jgi:effector-binding domain-containing protein